MSANSVQYSVETTSASDQGLTARGAPGIPLRGTPYLCGNDAEYEANHQQFTVQTLN